MATIEHCLYCFESLSAQLLKREPLALGTIQASYAAYTHAQHPDAGPPAAAAAGDQQIRDVDATYPLFVTWEQQRAGTGPYRLRGCIGTFSGDAPLAASLAEYAGIAALHDTRFAPVTARELPTLQCAVTLLTDFEAQDDLFGWALGTHGLRIAFVWRGKARSATYLPSVAEEQGWTQEQTLESLMRKAGWAGPEDWRTVAREGGMSVERYQGVKREVRYEEYQAWREWHKLHGPSA